MTSDNDKILKTKRFSPLALIFNKKVIDILVEKNDRRSDFTCKILRSCFIYLRLYNFQALIICILFNEYLKNWYIILLSLHKRVTIEQPPYRFQSPRAATRPITFAA